MWHNSNNSTMQNYALEGESTALPDWKHGQNCVPVMLGHLNRYGDELKIWGMPARMVTFVAILDEIAIVSTKVSFKFRDETGTLKGLKWLESGTSYECPVKTSSYARVYGSMRSQQADNYVLVTGIRPIEHLNELAAHLMEVTHMCLEAENSASRSAQNRSLAFNSNSSTNHDSTVPAGVSTHNNDRTTDNNNGLNRDQILIKEIISRGDPDNGAERNAIKSHVPSHLVPKVDEILEFLSSEGHVYTTISDDYFKLL